MPQKECAFFLGANSRHGFASLFEDLCAEQPARDVYMIKGGPGCGKSSLMRNACEPLIRAGEPAEYIYCSSDPDSLDGIVLRGRNAAVLDATPPHAMEPDFPGARGGYVPMPGFADCAALREKYPALQSLAERSRAHYAQARRLTCAAAQARDAVCACAAPVFDAARLARRAKGIIAREIPRGSGAPGIVRKRFLDGMTPRGLMRFDCTIDALCSRVYELSDSLGFSHVLLQPLLEGAVQRGCDVYACFSPIDPQRLCHVLIPELSLGFVSVHPSQKSPRTPYRRIRVDACADLGAQPGLRGKIRLLSRMSRSLLDDAAAELRSAHALHDEIEALYLPHLDFAALENTARSLHDALAH